MIIPDVLNADDGDPRPIGATLRQAWHRVVAGGEHQTPPADEIEGKHPCSITLERVRIAGDENCDSLSSLQLLQSQQQSSGAGSPQLSFGDGPDLADLAELLVLEAKFQASPQ